MKTVLNEKLHILIVENNPVDSKVVIGMLEKSPFGVFYIQSVDALRGAFELLQKEQFDVVLLDLNLNDSSGLDTLKVMHEKFPDIPIVVHSGVYQDDIVLKAVTIGAQDYLIKGHYLVQGLCKALYYAIERKKVERELQEAYNRLKDTQSQLIQAEKMNIIGAVASGVAHEVKNPLATIYYGIEFLKTKLQEFDFSDQKVDLALKTIGEAAQKADNIIKDLLDFSTLSNYQMDRESLNSVIQNALNLTTHQCQKHCIKVEQILDADLKEIKINKNRIEQVVVNLILNSINAMKEGGALRVRTYSETFSEKEMGWIDRRNRKINEGDLIIIAEIQDTGPGIKDDILPKIFDPFFTTRRGTGGIGLGLSIARTIMSNHYGYINIHNLEDKGVLAQLVFKV